MIYSAELCIDLPDDFPVAEYAAFMAEARRVLVRNGKLSPAWSEFGGASNLVGWRYRASFEAWQGHRGAIAANQSERNHEDVYLQERRLFLMFAAGTSCVESLVYALAAAASDSTVFGIPFAAEEQRGCNPRRVRSWLAPFPSAAALVAELGGLGAASEWKVWVDLRNRMTHRSNLPRRHFLSTGAVPPANPLNFAPTSSTPEVDADLPDWDALHGWLANQLKRLLVAGTHMLNAAP